MEEMAQGIKEFLHRKDIQEALDANNFDYIYAEEKKRKWRGSIGIGFYLTDTFLKAGIDFLSDISKIYDNMFRGLDIKWVTIPDSVTKIGDEAFKGCSSLKSIIIPDSVISIGEDAFYGCSALTSIIFPNSIIEINDKILYDCTSLTSITIPDSVESIGAYAFAKCKSLKVINYHGTKEQWEEIKKGRDWYKGSLLKKIVSCSDGDIEFRYNR